MLLAKYKWNQFTVYGGWEYIRYANPSDTYRRRVHDHRRFSRRPSRQVTSTNYTKPLELRHSVDRRRNTRSTTGST